MTGRLAGRVAVVTGAGSAGPGWGNGRAAAVIFACEGADVLAVDIDRSALDATITGTPTVTTSGEGSIRPHVCDVTDSEDVAAMVDACYATFGRIDVLVNNVGGSRPGGPVDLDEDTWSDQLNYNLTSTYLTCKHVLPGMVDAQHGAIVNTSSTSGIRWTGSAQAAYSAAKGGVIAFTRSLALQYAAHGIRANSVVPGQLHTPMVEARLANQRTCGDTETLLAQRQRRIPLGFAGDGRDTAHAALFLACDESRFVTGTELIVDGGMSARCD